MANKSCMVAGCDKHGRRIGKLADIELVYCAKHEDMGVRVLNFLVNSKFRYKFTRYLDEIRTDLFTDNEPKLSDESNKKIAEYVDKMIGRLDEIEK